MRRYQRTAWPLPILIAWMAAMIPGGAEASTNEQYYAWVMQQAYAPTVSQICPNGTGDLTNCQWNLRQLQDGEPYQWADAPRDVVIALIDKWPGYSGHPDMAGQYVPGWNFVEGNANTSVVWDGAAPTISNQHGPCVASMEAAIRGNGIGIDGAFHRAKIMPLRADFWTVDDAIDYAVSHGAEVIHMANFEDPGVRPGSLVWATPLSDNRMPWPDADESVATADQIRAIATALENAAAAGVVTVAGIGNRYGVVQPNLFGVRPETITAGPSNIAGELSPFTSFSFAFDVYAPGGDRRPVNWGGQSIPGLVPGPSYADYDDVLCAIGPDSYGTMSGGSASMPHVAASVAIIKSYLPGATVTDVRRLLRAASQPAVPSRQMAQGVAGVLSWRVLRGLIVAP